MVQENVSLSESPVPLPQEEDSHNTQPALWHSDNQDRQWEDTSQRVIWRIGEPNSDKIHLALVLCGKKKAQQARILAESVKLFSGGSSVHWHLIVEDEALAELKRTGFLSVTARHNSVYKMDKYFHIFDGTDGFLAKRYKYTWMWNKCKGMKVQLASVIPREIDRIILIDVDTMIVSPIDRLWQYFDDEPAHQTSDPISSALPLFHMVVDTSGHYNRTSHLTIQVHPPKIGFNSGVVLMHLDRMRDMSAHPAFLAEKLDEEQVSGVYDADLTDWGRLAFQVTKTQPSKVYYFLGDQDMFNAAISRYPELVRALPCGWNFQLVHSGLTWLKKACNVSSVEIHLVHGNGNRFMKGPDHVSPGIRGYTALYTGLRNLVVPELTDEPQQTPEDGGKT